MRVVSIQAVVILFGFFSNPVWGDSLFDTIFKENGKYVVPTDITQVRAKINQYACDESDPPVDPKAADVNGNSIDLSNSLLIPAGRSLQKSQTDYDNPRVVFNMNGAVQTKPPLVTHRNSINDKLFVGFSPKARTLEVISWDPSMGKYRFFLAKNYPKGPSGESPQYIENPAGECIKCHQSGGPILARAPWSETNSSISTTTKLCEKHPDGQYLGIKFADDCKCQKLQNGTLKCAPSALGPPFPPNTNGKGLSAANSLDLAVRSANRNAQTRRICQTLCGTVNSDTPACRRALLESALRFPRESKTFNLRLTKFTENVDPKTGQVIALIPLPKRKDFTQQLLQSESTTSPARIAELLATLEKSIQKTWPADGYSYRSDVLADRDPLTSPNTYTSVKDKEGVLNFDFESSGNSETRGLAGAELTPLVSSNGSVPLGGDPETQRPFADKISKQDAALYSVDIAFSCLGFDAKDALKIRACAAKTPGGLDALIASAKMQTAFQDLSASWPLPGPAGGAPSSEIQSRILNASCGNSPEASECHNDDDGLHESTNQLATVVQAANTLLQNRDISANRMKVVLGRCIECHDGNGDGSDFTENSGKISLNLFKKDPALLSEAIRRMNSHEDDHMPKGDFSPSQTTLDASDLQAWQKNGTPLNP
jgi:hypothetical protein